MWLLDAGDRLHESTQLVGLDISLEAAPPREVLPSNITFQRWDVNDPVPDGLLGAFDIINVRFMVFVVRKDDVPATVGKLLQMLSEFGSDPYLHTTLLIISRNPPT